MQLFYCKISLFLYFFIAVKSTLLSQETPPNIIFFLVDDQGWNGTSVQMDEHREDSKSDYYHTPYLEELAANGMRFSKAYSPSPICAASRAAIMMGQSTARTRMTLNPETNVQLDQLLIDPNRALDIDTSDLTYAEILKEAGYNTGYIAKWHIYGGGPEENGFDIQIHGGPANHGSEIYHNPKSINSITNKSIDYITEIVNDSVPFFFQIGHQAVHLNVECTQETYDSLEGVPVGDNHKNRAYAAMTEDLDKGLGAIMDLVESLGIADNTYIVYYSDNGAVRFHQGQELSPSTPLKHGKLYYSDGGHRVPLIISGPGIAPNSHCHFPVIGYDLFPTFVEMAGLDKSVIPNNKEGGSLLPTLLNQGQLTPDREDKSIYFHFPHNYIEFVNQYSMIIDYPFKLINFMINGEKRIYNLEEDIGEENEINDPELLSRLIGKMKDHLEEVDAQMPLLNENHPDNTGSTHDRDNDILPDVWEFKELLTASYGPSDDPDGDGFTNLEEYLNDTDPYKSDNNGEILISLNDLSSVFGLNAFPNPVSSNLYIENNLGITRAMHIQITDALGKEIYLKDGQLPALLEINLNRYSLGIYFLKIHDDLGNSAVHKFIVK